MVKPKLIFEKLGLENFGSFHNYQEIHFSTDSVKNVTLITGEIGSGKTTLFQALYWALFPQEAEKHKIKEIKFLRSNEIINVVNNLAIKNAEIGDIIQIRVLLKFRRRNEVGNSISYEIIRRRQYKKIKVFDQINNDDIDKKEIIEYVHNSDSLKLLKNGNSISVTEYYKVIEENLPSAVRNFVFIHGEGGIAKLLSLENIGGLKKSILSISDYPRIKGLEKYLKACLKYFDGKRKEWMKGNKKLENKNKEIINAENTIKELQKKLDKSVKKQEDAYNSIIDLENELEILNQNSEDIKDYKVILDKISKLEERKYGNKIKKGKGKIKGNIKEREEKLLRYAPILYLEGAINLCIEDIKKKRKKGIFPGNSIPKKYLKMIRQNSDACICGTNWDNKMKENFDKLISSAQDNSMIEELNKFEGYLLSQKDRIKEAKKEINNLQEKLWDINDDLTHYKDQKFKYERRIDLKMNVDENFNDFQELSSKKGFLNQEYGRIQEEIKTINKKIEDENNSLDKIQKDYNKLETQHIKKQGGKDAFYYKNIVERLESIEKIRNKLEISIMDKIKEATSEATDNILVELVNNPDQWQNVTITDTGSGWEVNARFRDTIVTNTSSGMTNVLGLSFIFALSYILDVDLPLIFDSPFGNLDAATRDLIAVKLPSIFRGRQIIFFEKRINLLGSKDLDKASILIKDPEEILDNEKIKDLYPILKEFVDFEYHLVNSEIINTKIKKIK